MDPNESNQGPSDEEFALALGGLHKRLHRACRYAHQTQDLTAQSIGMILAELLQEVISEWLYEDLAGEPEDDEEGL